MTKETNPILTSDVETLCDLATEAADIIELQPTNEINDPFLPMKIRTLITRIRRFQNDTEENQNVAHEETKEINRNGLEKE